jgi:hypothetical protein
MFDMFIGVPIDIDPFFDGIREKSMVEEELFDEV